MRTIVVIRLADRSNCYPKGFKKDVLVPENELIFPADFSVLERKKEPMPAKLLLMLGHPFLTITGTRIDVLEETLTTDSTYSKQRGTQTMFFHAFILMCSIHLCWIYLIQVWEMTRPCFLTRKFTTSFLFLLSCPPLPSVVIYQIIIKKSFHDKKSILCLFIEK